MASCAAASAASGLRAAVSASTHCAPSLRQQPAVLTRERSETRCAIAQGNPLQQQATDVRPQLAQPTAPPHLRQQLVSPMRQETAPVGQGRAPRTNDLGQADPTAHRDEIA